jgi:tRNA(Met) cytidine acetyltransferase
LTGKLLIDWLKQRQQQISHRQLLLISGNSDWCEQQLVTLLEHFQGTSLLLSNEAESQGKTLTYKTDKHCQISQYKQQLGSEHDLLIYNAFDGLKPSAL